MGHFDLPCHESMAGSMALETRCAAQDERELRKKVKKGQQTPKSVQLISEKLKPKKQKQRADLNIQLLMKALMQHSM